MTKFLNKKPFFAEVSANHCGSILKTKTNKTCKKSGADAVKLQITPE